jgi:hypothetical protein
MNFGVHHQAYKNFNAVEKVLSDFRKFHPEEPYILWSDAGSDYSELAEKYKVKYFYSDLNVGLKKYSKDQAYIFFDRIRKSFEIINKKYAVWMEDDVLIRGTISIDESVDFSGLPFTGNYFWGTSFEYLTKKYSIMPNVKWFGSAGGSVLNKDVFVDNFNIIEKFIDEDYEYIRDNIWTEIGHADIMITIAHFLCNKKYSVNLQLTDANKNPGWKTSDHVLVHSFKDFY